MMLPRVKCAVFAHRWQLVGGLARNAHPTKKHPATSEYHCQRCGTVEHVDGVDCAVAPRSPDKLPDQSGVAVE